MLNADGNPRFGFRGDEPDGLLRQVARCVNWGPQLDAQDREEGTRAWNEGLDMQEVEQNVANSLEPLLGKRPTAKRAKKPKDPGAGPTGKKSKRARLEEDMSSLIGPGNPELPRLDGARQEDTKALEEWGTRWANAARATREEPLETF